LLGETNLQQPNAAGINYNSLRLQDTLKRVQSMDGFTLSR
jgi:hypothetical protein